MLYLATSQADPLNPRRCFEEQGSRYETLSLLELPDAPPQSWTEERPGSSCGTLRQFPFSSRLLQDSRSVSVYTPPGYSEKASAYGLLLLFDGQWYLSRARATTILDNLLTDGKIPPLVTVFIGNGPGDARGRQLPCNPAFAAFLADELMPWVRANYHVTDKPANTIIAGASYGGLAAAYAALRHPELFGNVLSQSGSFWWYPPQTSGQGCNETNYIASLVVGQPRLPLRFYLEAGSGELDFSGSGRSILSSSRHLRDVLLAKGYAVAYQEFIGGHGFLYWRGTLADGLMQLTADWDD
jgi:enterochelin esterase family protein